MFNKKYLFYAVIICINQQQYSLAGNGGSVAAGVLGGFGAGAIIGAVASSNKRPREVIYVENDYLPYNRRRSSNFEFSNWEQDLIEMEDNLFAKKNRLKKLELSLKRKAKLLENKERELNKKISVKSNKKEDPTL